MATAGWIAALLQAATSRAATAATVVICNNSSGSKFGNAGKAATIEKTLSTGQNHDGITKTYEAAAGAAAGAAGGRGSRGRGSSSRGAATTTAIDGDTLEGQRHDQPGGGRSSMQQ